MLKWREVSLSETAEHRCMSPYMALGLCHQCKHAGRQIMSPPDNVNTVDDIQKNTKCIPVFDETLRDSLNTRIALAKEKDRLLREIQEIDDRIGRPEVT